MRTENTEDSMWREIAEEVHKDADNLFKMIGEAYAILSDPTKVLLSHPFKFLRSAHDWHDGFTF